MLTSSFVVIGSIVLAIACSSPETESTNFAVAQAGDLTVALATDRASVPPGADLGIRVTVTNVTSSARSLKSATSCFTSFEFLDASGRVIGAASPICQQVVSARTLAAGDSFTDSHSWTRGPSDFPQLPAGTYQVRAILLTTDSLRSTPVPVVLP